MRAENRKQNLLNVALMGLFGAAVMLASGSKAHGEQPSADDREKFHAAMEACVAETGVAKPEKGQRPSEEDRQKIDACLDAKGISKPAHGPGHRNGGRPPGPPPEEIQSSGSAS